MANRVVSRPASARRANAAPPPAAPTLARRRTLIAASQRIDIKTREGVALIRKPEDWQKDAWAFFRSVPGVAFAAGFMGNALSRIRLFPGIVIDPDEPPVALDEAVGQLGVTDGLADAATQEMARIANSRDGWPGVLRGFGVNLSIAGEGNLIGRPTEDDDLSEEQWGVYSSSAISTKGSGDGREVFLKESKGGRPVKLPRDEATFFARIWRRDPEFPGDPYANIRSVLDVCEELVIYSRVFRAIAKSGANGGILKMPSQLDLETPVAAGEDEGAQDDLTPLQRSYLDHVTQSIEDDASASGAAPWVLDGAYDFLDRVEWINTSRSIDQKALDRIEGLKEELAHGLDLPVEVIKGMAGANHWSAWQIEDSTYKAHVEPTVGIVAAGVASSFLRPGLVDEFPSEVVRQVVVGVDASALVVRPNRAADVKDAHDRITISDEYYRSELGIPESAAPDDAEVERREARRRPRALPSGEPDTPAEDGGEPIPATLPAAARPYPDGWAPLALTAAADDDDNDPWWLLGLALARIETRLLDRLTVAASDDAADALRKAGSKLKSQAQGNPATRDRVNGADPNDVPALLGPELVAAMADPDSLLAGSLDRLAGRWDTWVAAAQAEVADRMERLADLAPDPAGAKAAIQAFRDGAAAARSDGWVEAERQLRGLLSDRLTGNIIDVVEGEGDPHSHVPAGLLRDALARAGGGMPGVGPSGSAQHSGPGGLTTGPQVRRLLDALGATVMAWRWDHGMPATPFPPHQALDGVVFDRWDDTVLASVASWPPVAHYWPGDHRGCTCGVVPVINGQAVEAIAAAASRNGGK